MDSPGTMSTGQSVPRLQAPVGEALELAGAAAMPSVSGSGRREHASVGHVDDLHGRPRHRPVVGVCAGRSPEPARPFAVLEDVPLVDVERVLDLVALDGIHVHHAHGAEVADRHPAVHVGHRRTAGAAQDDLVDEVRASLARIRSRDDPELG
jgi:hypothetical protein